MESTLTKEKAMEFIRMAQHYLDKVYYFEMEAPYDEWIIYCDARVSIKSLIRSMELGEWK